MRAIVYVKAARHSPLVRDENQSQRYKAAKVLTACATVALRYDFTHELDVSVALHNKWTQMRGVLPDLDDHFAQNGPHGVHYCFILDVMGINVRAFRSAAPTRSLAVCIVKPVLACVVAALDTMHSLGVIHAGVLQDRLSEITHDLILTRRCERR